MTPQTTKPVTKLPAEVVPWAPRCVLGESPRWHDGRWWWIDATVGLVYRHRPNGDASMEVATPWLSLGRRVSLVHPARPDGILVAAEPNLLIYQDTAEAIGGAESVRDLTTLRLPDGWNLNDGVGAPGGGLYIGVVSPDRGPTGYLQHIRADGSLGGTVPNIRLSNGLALDRSGSVLYHADSFARRIFAHRLGPAGDVLGTADYLVFADSDGLPDGIATDEADCLWVAMYGVGEVRRYTADGGLDLVLSFPTPQVTSVALGGADGRDVLITTAREGYDEARSAAEPLAGRLFSARAPTPGLAFRENA